MFCPKCGTKNDDDVRSCISCGSQFVNPQAGTFQQQANQFQHRPSLSEQGQFQQMPPLQQSGQFAPIYQKPKKSKAGIVVLVIVLILIIGTVAVIWLNDGFPGLNVRKAYITTAIDPVSSEPMGQEVNVLSSAPTIYVAALIKNVGAGVNVVSVWHYIDGGDTVVSETLFVSYDTWINFYLSQPYTGFPIGSYSVELYVNEQLQKTVYFKVY